MTEVLKIFDNFFGWQDKATATKPGYGGDFTEGMNQRKAAGISLFPVRK